MSWLENQARARYDARNMPPVYQPPINRPETAQDQINRHALQSKLAEQRLRETGKLRG